MQRGAPNVPDNRHPEAKANRGQFKKGQSGNPGGKPKALREVIELAREHTELAVSRLAHWATMASQLCRSLHLI
ncbi:DUF5681 domain-containing protein [Gluconacetobacter diazotrophicus]|uniref:DUF5681 domain-containing protein n=1 Tax=Gluconacetobacter diazotrophicus TaxID=33996 RepID=UPI0036F244D5